MNQWLYYSFIKIGSISYELNLNFSLNEQLLILIITLLDLYLLILKPYNFVNTNFKKDYSYNQVL